MKDRLLPYQIDKMRAFKHQDKKARGWLLFWKIMYLTFSLAMFGGMIALVIISAQNLHIQKTDTGSIKTVDFTNGKWLIAIIVASVLTLPAFLNAYLSAVNLCNWNNPIKIAKSKDKDAMWVEIFIAFIGLAMVGAFFPPIIFKYSEDVAEINDKWEKTYYKYIDLNKSKGIADEDGLLIK